MTHSCIWHSYWALIIIMFVTAIITVNYYVMRLIRVCLFVWLQQRLCLPSCTGHHSVHIYVQCHFILARCKEKPMRTNKVCMLQISNLFGMQPLQVLSDRVVSYEPMRPCNKLRCVVRWDLMWCFKFQHMWEFIKANNL